MSVRWEQDFDFWAARLDETTVQIFLDMAAFDHAPVASHPTRLQVRITLSRPREDGLLSEDEANAVYDAEDAIVAKLTETYDTIFVGRLVAEGFATLAFYLPRAAGPRADQEVGALLAPTSSYRLQWRVEDDPEWSYYRELLYPDDDSKKEMLSRRARDRVLGVGESSE